jgi:hypothetical protein
LITLSAIASTPRGIVNPNAFAGLEVDAKLELDRLLDRKIGSLGAFNIQSTALIVGPGVRGL